MKKYTLPKEFATKWVEALRHNPYGQIKSDLYEPMIDGKDKECFCANGIGLLILGIPKMELIFHSYVDKDLYSKYPNIPKSLVEHLTPKGEINLFDKIVNQNDFKSKSFPEIADWITSNVEFI
jgi:hypothetical protein